MHTHFGSATHGFATFLSVLIFGTFWRLSWAHIMKAGANRGSQTLQGLARAALLQF